MSAVVDFPVKPEARPYLEAFGRDFSKHSREPGWLAGQRRRSLARFAELGFPSRRSEAWRYLDLRALEETPMLPVGSVRSVAGVTATVQCLGGTGGHREPPSNGTTARARNRWLEALAFGLWIRTHE